MHVKNENNEKYKENVRIYHENILWFIYRALSEELIINKTMVDEEDNVRRKIDE